MVKMNDVSPNDLINQMAKELKQNEQINQPDWAEFVKTASFKERPPKDKDWWYTRVASVLRSVAVLGPVGVSKLKTKYGGKKNRGHQPEKFYKGSGSILRKSLQQLEAAGFIKHEEINRHKGRKLTPDGQKFINDAVKKVKRD